MRSQLLGMDEAGYGPNLGPLIIAITEWNVSGRPELVDLYAALESVASREPDDRGGRLQVADSKVVLTGKRGLARLEATVLAAVGVLAKQNHAPPPTSFRQLWQLLANSGPAAFQLTKREPPAWQHEPWFAENDLHLPHFEPKTDTHAHTQALYAACQSAGVELRCLIADVVLTRRFNNLVQQHNSKGLALSELSLRLAARVLNEPHSGPRLMIADKHGGRNKYRDMLRWTFGDDSFVMTRREGSDFSHYHADGVDVRFQTRAEEHFPVALASMVCKYLRQLAMVLFNQYWQARQPDLEPTAGYPTDAIRFRRDVAALRGELKIDDNDFWRCR